MGGSHPGARASRPQPYSCKQPAIQGHSLEQCTKPAFAGFATMVPSPMRARRPRSRVGVLPFTLAPQESVSGCRAAALPCRSCERASCNIGSGTGRFAGNRDVLPISIVGCDLVKKGSSPQKAQKAQNGFRDFESWQSEVDPHGDGLTGCMQIARNLCDGFGSQRLAGFQCSALFVFFVPFVAISGKGHAAEFCKRLIITSACASLRLTGICCRRFAALKEAG